MIQVLLNLIIAFAVEYFIDAYNNVISSSKFFTW